MHPCEAIVPTGDTRRQSTTLFSNVVGTTLVVSAVSEQGEARTRERQPGRTLSRRVFEDWISVTERSERGRQPLLKSRLLFHDLVGRVRV